MLSDFVPELQRHWSLESLTMPKTSEAVVRLAEFAALEAPAPMGRTVSDVVSWPTMWQTVRRAEIRFSGIEVLRVSEELHAAEASDAVYSGTSFRRYATSSLIRAHSDAGGATPRYHFRIVFQDDVLDVLCAEPPEITIEPFD